MSMSMSRSRPVPRSRSVAMARSMAMALVVFCCLVSLSYGQEFSYPQPSFPHSPLVNPWSDLKLLKETSSRPFGLVEVQNDLTIQATQVTTTTSESWLSLMGKSIVGVLFGIFMFLGAFPLLIWNEIQSAKQYRLLSVAKTVCKNLPDDQFHEEYNGKLVCLHSATTTTEQLADRPFNINFPNSIKWKRLVEMYQWREEKSSRTEDDNFGGRTTVTTYSYTKNWSSIHISSNDFKEQVDHQNPEFPFPQANGKVSKVSVGTFHLSTGSINEIDWYHDRKVSQEELEGLPNGMNKTFTIQQDKFWKGDAANPQIGDVRVSFQVINNGDVTVIGKQVNNTFVGWEAPWCGFACCASKEKEFDEEKQQLMEYKSEDDVSGFRQDKALYIRQGHQLAIKIFEELETKNFTVTMIIRIVGFLLMFFGLYLILNPVVTLLRVIPFIGTFFANLLSVGIFFVCFLSCLILTLVIVSIAWVFARPFLTLGLILTGVSLFLIITLAKKH